LYIFIQAFLLCQSRLQGHAAGRARRSRRSHRGRASRIPDGLKGPWEWPRLASSVRCEAAYAKRTFRPVVEESPGAWVNRFDTRRSDIRIAGIRDRVVSSSGARISRNWAWASTAGRQPGPRRIWASNARPSPGFSQRSRYQAMRDW